MVTELKVATPAAAVASVVPPRVHEEASCMVSTDPVPVGTTLPYWSSTETLKVVNATPTVPDVGGTVVYAILVAAVGVTTIAPLVAVVTPDVVVSDATSVQLVPVVIVTAVKVATPATAGTEVVPVRVHEEVICIVSVEPVPDVITIGVLSSTETEKLASALPAFVGVVGAVVKITLLGKPAADAGDTETNARPVTMRAEAAPMATTDLIEDLADLKPVSRLHKFLIGLPPLHCPSGSNA
jgi:hypothetical protein